MRSNLLTAFVVALVILISISLAHAEVLKWRIDLTVDSIEGEIPGIAIGDQFVARFEVDSSILENPDGIQDGRFISFDLSIGEVNWNQSQSHVTPQFLLSSGRIDAVSTIITYTVPTHPDFSSFLPESPASWEVKDENDMTGKPIFGGNFRGTYTVSPVSDCACDINNDGKTGLEEAIYALQVVSGIHTKDCMNNIDCEENYYCSKPETECDAIGYCVEIPTNCPDLWYPVCGCDGRTYGNECEAAAEGVNVAQRGECRSTSM